MTERSLIFTVQDDFIENEKARECNIYGWLCQNKDGYLDQYKDMWKA